ncbi:unnamed protein product, partial [Didymodactylos carnosus]
GKLEFNRVSFVYPTRPNRIVLRQFSLQINPDQCIAIVGMTIRNVLF